MADLLAKDHNDYDPEKYLELAVDIDAADDFEREVLAPLRAAGLDAEFPPRGSGIPLETWAAAIKLAGDSAALLLLIAKSVAAWQRKHHRQQQKPTQPGQIEVWRIRYIERPGQPPLTGAQILDEVELLHYITGNNITGNTRQQVRPALDDMRSEDEGASTSMNAPNIGEIVWYVMPSQRFAPAIVVRVHDQDTLNVVVFGDADDGTAFASGAVPKTRVRRWQRQDPSDPNEYPTAGMWFAPVGPSAPAGAPGTNR